MSTNTLPSKILDFNQQIQDNEAHLATRPRSNSSNKTRYSRSNPSLKTSIFSERNDRSRISRAASVAASIQGLEPKRPKINIWPEWNDVDVNAEKWSPDINLKQPIRDAAKKEDKKGKSPTVSHAYFDDPDGKIEMPPSLRVDYWKRPGDFIDDKAPCIVDTDNVYCGFDLISKNEHLHESELLRFCISQIMALWDMLSVPVPPDVDMASTAPGDDPSHSWRPWEHIYSLCKAGKGPHLPLYNSHGKYIVRLYWMGCWRKIVIDDTIPFDDQGRMLLPCTTLTHELWPILLTKALIKVASLDYAGGNPSQEFGDMAVIQCLTGWIPEAIPLLPSHTKQVWELMKTSLPEWTLPEQEWEKPKISEFELTKESDSLQVANPNLSHTSVLSKKKSKREAQKEEAVAKDGTKGDMKDNKGEKGKEGKGKEGKDKEKGKDDKKDKSKDKDKDKGNVRKKTIHEEKSGLDDFVLPEKPELVMLATYSSAPKFPCKVSLLGEMADASEKLRQNGLSHLYPHPVCIAQTRSCPLEPPPPPISIPAWKLIRPRKRKTPPHDEPVVEPVPPKPIQCLEITSAFLNYKVSPVPIPTDIHRPKSSLERGGARSRADKDGAIEERDENAPSPPPESALEESESKLRNSTSRDKSVSRRPESRQSNKSEEIKSEKTKGYTDASSPQNIAGGLAPSLSHLSDPENPVAVEDPVQMPHTDNTPKPKKAWMDFDTFCRCFNYGTLYVFHKSNTYLCNQYYSDLKNVTPSSSTSVSKVDKKPNAVNAAPNDGSPFYLFVDNLSTTEIVVSYSVLSRWFEPAANQVDEKKNANQNKQPKEKDLEKETTNASISLESVTGEQKPPPSVTPGTLVAEPHSWKSLESGQPKLRLRTTGTKSAVLTLPAGRHVLKFMMSSPLGHHVHMCSTVNFVFGDEETVMAQLKNESCRFRDCAAQIITNLGKAIQSFQDKDGFNNAWEDFCNSHCPYMNDKQMSKRHHFEVFNEALYAMLKQVIKDVMSADMAFSWRAFNFDATSKNILAIPVGSRPATGSASVRGSAKPSSKKLLTVESTDSIPLEVGEAEKPENPWANREASIEEQIAAVKVQRMWRGYFVRKLKEARLAGSDENPKVFENLSKCWSIIEANIEENGLVLLREMFKRDPDLMTAYPFHQDEWNKISYSDYKGSYPEQTSMNWFIVFRDIFYVKEEMLLVPRLYVPINTCMLRVIDNDTQQEIPRVFQRVAPYVYKKNKKGYSFVAEARTIEQPLSSGNWRMRLIGSLPGLPQPLSGEVCSNFITKEIKDYYVPNPKNIIFRQSVKVTEDHFASLQVNTSKQDVYIKLAVLDNEEEIISAFGKGHVVIPAFTFLKDITQEDIDNRRSSSRGSRKSSSQILKTLQEENEENENQNSADDAGRGPVPLVEKKSDKSNTKLKRTESALSTEQTPPSRSSMRSDAELAERLEDSRPHKYILQATVLQNSWPLSEGHWRFVQILKDMEKNELKVYTEAELKMKIPIQKTPNVQQSNHTRISISVDKKMSGANKKKQNISNNQSYLSDVSSKDRAPSPIKQEKLAVANSKTKVEKGSKNKSKDKGHEGKVSRPSSQQFDITKPNWTLRVVSDAVAAEEIEIKKDTERADEIRAMKRAWEDAQPGRAAKALQSRLKYLNSHTIKLAASEPEVEQHTEVNPNKPESNTTYGESEDRVPTPVSFGENLDNEGPLTLEPPNPPTPKEILEPLDITPFIRKTLPVPRYLDKEEMDKLIEKRKRDIEEFRAFREQVEQWRENDKQARNRTKILQLEQCQALQNALDCARERINVPREAIRQKFLLAEQKKLEELALLESAKVEVEAKSPKGRKKNSASKKKGK